MPRIPLLNKCLLACFLPILLWTRAYSLPLPDLTSTPSKKYVTVELMGQFGNQLFQIATAHAYALDHHLSLTIPALVTQKEYNIPHNAQNVFLRYIPSYVPHHRPTLVWSEPNFNYSPIPHSSRIKLKGWFQSEKYFSHRREEILELFAAPPGLNQRILDKYPFLDSPIPVVGIQIRDYRVEELDGKYHPTIGREYYEKAIALFPKETIFVISSNNRDYAKKCIEGLAKHLVYLSADYIEEFYTLVLCKSFIISNSTFGWWAAWLSTAESKRVVVPTPWFAPPYEKTMEKDLIPPRYEIIKYES